jgi:malonyl-CoA/methylmalonyl-CoA synthetase
LACWHAGAIAVPLHPQHPDAELEYVLRDSGARAVVASSEHLDVATRIAGASDATVVDVRTGGMEHRSAPGRDEPALMVYTSGTTGRPKGAVHTHGGVEAMVDAMLTAWGWTADDRIVLVLPLNHVHGLINVTVTALAAGACCEAPGAFDAIWVWERFASGEVTLFMAVPTIYARLTSAWEQAGGETQRAWSAGAAGLRLMVCGSAALPVSTLDRWREISGQVLLERYGMTELGMALSNSLDRRVPGHVGEPMPGTGVRVVDEGDADVPDGEPGELLVRGPQVFAGYWGRPDATAAAFTDGWFRTGDVAVHEPEGLPAPRPLVRRHHQDRWREGLGARDRGGLPHPPRRRRLRGRRHRRRRVGRAGVRGGCPCGRSRAGGRGTAVVGQAATGAGQGAVALRVRRRASPQHAGQGRQARRHEAVRLIAG